MTNIISMRMGQRIRRANPKCMSTGTQLWCTRIRICPTCTISIGIELSFNEVGISKSGMLMCGKRPVRGLPFGLNGQQLDTTSPHANDTHARVRANRR